jgi:hypothetical protein
MLRMHVADRLAVSAGLVPSERPARHAVSLAVVATVLSAVVGMMSLYVGVREITQSGAPANGGEYLSLREIQGIIPAAGGDKLMSIEDMKALAGQDQD